MKFLLFAAGALAASTVKRQASAIVSAIGDIQSATEALGTAVSGFSGVGDAPGILSASSTVQSAIQAGIDAVGATDTLDTLGASQLITPVQDLSAAVKTAIDAAIAKKDALVSAGLGGETSTQLKSIQTLATQFSSDLVGKVPTSLQQTAQGLAAPIAADLQRGVDAFADVPSGSASASAPATTSESASATTSEAPSTTASASESASASASASATESGSAPPSYTSASATSSAPPTATYTGAAVANAAGFGMIAAAGLAVLAF